MAKKKEVVVEETVEVVPEVVETPTVELDKELSAFEKRHPGANPAMIYE